MSRFLIRGEKKKRPDFSKEAARKGKRGIGIHSIKKLELTAVVFWTMMSLRPRQGETRR